MTLTPICPYNPRPMANTSSAKKKVRVIARKTEVNKSRRTRVRTFIKKVDAAVQTGDHAKSMEAFRKAEKELMHAVSKGVFKLNTAARKISRLNTMVKKLAA